MSRKEKSLDLANELIALLNQEKAEAINIIDLEGKTEIADYMIVACGLNKRHISSLAEKIELWMKNEHDYISVHIEGLENCEWVLIDCFDVIIHLFQPEIREHYKLEDLWNIEINRE